MNATSRDSRSSLAIANSHFGRLAVFNAALSSGRRSSASNPLPLSTSVNSAMTSKPSASAKADERLASGHQDQGPTDLASGSRHDSKRRADVTIRPQVRHTARSSICRIRRRHTSRLTCDISARISRAHRRAATRCPADWPRMGPGGGGLSCPFTLTGLAGSAGPRRADHADNRMALSARPPPYST